jgi:uncharacterized membrane protein (Fun14 family)
VASNLPLEDLVFSGAGGFLFGAFTGYSARKLMRIVIVVVGLFFTGMMYISYKGYISVHWDKLQTDTTSAIQNATIQAGHIINNTAQNMAHHGTSSINGIPIAAGVMFIPGMLLGWHKA